MDGGRIARATSCVLPIRRTLWIGKMMNVCLKLQKCLYNYFTLLLFMSLQFSVTFKYCKTQIMLNSEKKLLKFSQIKM